MFRMFKEKYQPKPISHPVELPSESASSDSSPRMYLKCLVIGDRDCGKTSFIRKMGEPHKYFGWESGVGYKEFKVEFEHEPVGVTMELWDTRSGAYNPEDRLDGDGYARGAKLYFVLFSITDSNSFEWVKKCLGNDKSFDPNNIILVGTKTDLIASEVVTPDEACDFAKQKNITLFYSSKDDKSVQLCYKNDAGKIVNVEVEDMLSDIAMAQLEIRHKKEREEKPSASGGWCRIS